MNVLELTGLRKSFRSPDGTELAVLDLPSFLLAEGEQAALRGPSGSGKTTLLNVIAGLLRPDEGRVVVAGQEISALSEAARDRFRALYVSTIFQTFNLLQGYTALENVLLGMMFGPGPDAARARELLTRVGLADRLDHKPRQLSTGQQQRVAVARALANRPKLVLADEPTGNLDARHAGEALDLIRATCKEAGAALLLVSHDPDVIARFERIEDLSVLNRAAGSVRP